MGVENYKSRNTATENRNTSCSFERTVWIKDLTLRAAPKHLDRFSANNASLVKQAQRSLNANNRP